jgi:hypothetical protein
MSLAFVDRPPTPEEFERFRVILSTYQDGSGMLAMSDSSTLPGWRDFERTVAAAFSGVAQGDKSIFDVLITAGNSKTQYGISCKMRGELNRLDKDGRVTIELSNSIKKFQDYLALKGIAPEKYVTRAKQVGGALVDLVEQWKRVVSLEQDGQSGGQLKYYPLAKDALWASERFRLEPIPANRRTIDLAAKAQMYFPELWAKSAGA